MIKDISGGFSFFFLALAASAAALAAAAPSSSSSSPKRSRSSSSALAGLAAAFGFSALPPFGCCCLPVSADGLRAFVHSLMWPKAAATYGTLTYAVNQVSTFGIVFLNPGSMYNCIGV